MFSVCCGRDKRGSEDYTTELPTIKLQKQPINQHDSLYNPDEVIFLEDDDNSKILKP